jgi:hypothetical protein
MKGCYLWCADPETNSYFKARMGQISQRTSVPQTAPFPIVPPEEVRPFENCVPLFDLKVAAGGFSGFQHVHDFQWVALPEIFSPKPGYFICRVVGESMNRIIPSGSWCLFKPASSVDFAGKVLLVQHRDIQDETTGGQFTVKACDSVEDSGNGDGHYGRIVLKPRSKDPGYKAMEIVWEVGRELRVIGEFVAVLGESKQGT